MVLRGASEEEISKTIRTGEWKMAKNGKFSVKCQFDFNKVSLINQKFYKYKTIEPIFVEEYNEIIVITVKVYYFN